MALALQVILVVLSETCSGENVRVLKNVCPDPDTIDEVIWFSWTIEPLLYHTTSTEVSVSTSVIIVMLHVKVMLVLTYRVPIGRAMIT